MNRDIFSDGIYGEDLKPSDTKYDPKYSTRKEDHLVGGLSNGTVIDDTRRHQVNTDVPDDLSGVQSRRLSALSNAGNAGKVITPGSII